MVHQSLNDVNIPIIVRKVVPTNVSVPLVTRPPLSTETAPLLMTLASFAQLVTMATIDYVWTAPNVRLAISVRKEPQTRWKMSAQLVIIVRKVSLIRYVFFLNFFFEKNYFLKHFAKPESSFLSFAIIRISEYKKYRTWYETDFKLMIPSFSTSFYWNRSHAKPVCLET